MVDLQKMNNNGDIWLGQEDLEIQRWLHKTEFQTQKHLGIGKDFQCDQQFQNQILKIHTSSVPDETYFVASFTKGSSTHSKESN